MSFTLFSYQYYLITYYLPISTALFMCHQWCVSWECLSPQYGLLYKEPREFIYRQTGYSFPYGLSPLSPSCKMCSYIFKHLLWIIYGSVIPVLFYSSIRRHCTPSAGWENFKYGPKGYTNVHHCWKKKAGHKTVHPLPYSSICEHLSKWVMFFHD